MVYENDVKIERQIFFFFFIGGTMGPFFGC